MTLKGRIPEVTSSGAPHGGHCLSSWSQNLPGGTRVRRREQVPGSPLPPAPSRSDKALQLPTPGIGSQSLSAPRPAQRTWSLRLRSAEAVKLQAEWKEARSSLGGVPRAAAGFGLTLCGAQASVPDRGLVAVYCGPGCYLALKGAWQPGSVHDDLFLHNLVLCRHMGRGQHPSTPTPAPSRHGADRGPLTELGNVLARQNPRASFQASPRPEEETRSQGSSVF